MHNSKEPQIILKFVRFLRHICANTYNNTTNTYICNSKEPQVLLKLVKFLRQICANTVLCEVTSLMYQIYQNKRLVCIHMISLCPKHMA